MTTDWKIHKVRDRYWLSKFAWRQGSFRTLHDAVCEEQRVRGYTMLEFIQRERIKAAS